MSDSPPPPGPPPGWYADPTTGHGFRWWDGQSWTEQTSETADLAADGSPLNGLQPVGEWMSEVFRIVASRAGHLFPMIVLLMVPVGLANGMSLWLSFREAVMTTNSETGEVSFSNPGGSAANYGLVFATFILVILATVFLSISVARQALVAVDGEEAEPWSASMLHGLSRLARAIGVVIAVLGALFGLYVVMVFTAAISPALLLLTFPAWVVGSFWLGTRLSLGHMAAAVAPRGVKSLSTSWELTRGHFWTVFGRMLLLALIGAATSLVAGLISAPFTSLVGGGSDATFEPGAEQLRFGDLLGDNPAVFAIGQLFNALGNGAATVIWAVGLVLMYRNLSGPTESLVEAEVEYP